VYQPAENRVSSVKSQVEYIAGRAAPPVAPR